MKPFFVLPIVSLACLISCVGPSADQRVQLEAEAKRAMDAFADHAIAVVPSLDDRVSDARTIALAVTNACATEYNAWVEAKVQLSAQTGQGKRLFRQLAYSADGKIQWGLPVVLRYRNGTLRKPTPPPN